MKVSIAIPDDMYQAIEDYCEEFGATRSGFIQKCIRAGLGLTAKHERFPENFITPRENTEHLETKKKTSPTMEDLRKIATAKKQISKSRFCPHFITKGGACEKCGGLAK